MVTGGKLDAETHVLLVQERPIVPQYAVAYGDSSGVLRAAIQQQFPQLKVDMTEAGQLRIESKDGRHIAIETKGHAEQITGLSTTARSVRAARTLEGVFIGSKTTGMSYVWFVDLFFAGILGVGLYFHFSGRVWCRFACPLAALMHIYTRFSKFRIFAEKKKCISCNVCTSVCHQGIDIMNFANKGMPMEDPECVRCSACVQSCPTGVLQFGRYGAHDEIIYDRLPASLVKMTEALNKG